MYDKRKAVRKPSLPATDKQKRFLSSLIAKKYAHDHPTQQGLLAKIDTMQVGAANMAIKQLLGMPNR